ncbi:response regulator transcription factor [Treponema sp.]|uniref:response regulator transcription factor n=1 Tax=Treponema sp. TaxID=166 RepID=UPI00298D7E21|nr:response regulator transcription factor [Treponema sp.]
MNKNRIVIIDDHEIFIQGLSFLIGRENDFEVVGTALNFFDAEKLVKKLQPDLAIIDLNLGDKDGLELIQLFTEKYPRTKILVLSMMEERYYAQRCLACGARGYIMKAMAADTVISAIKTVLAGKIWLSDTEQSRYINSLFYQPGQNLAGKDLIKTLTNRQLQIFRMLGSGQGTIEIANALSLSSKTVEAHKEQLKKKLNCKSAQELLQLAISWSKE